MAIIATGSKTIIDLSDGKSLSCYLGANHPRYQIYNQNDGTYSPNWQTTNLRVTPVIYANQTPIDHSDSHLVITWKRKEGSGDEGNLDSQTETVSENILTVSANKMSSSVSMLTYIAHAVYTDPDTTLPINATAEITFAFVTTGQNAKTAWISGEQAFKYETASGTPTPAQIELTAHLQNVRMTKWQYKNSTGDWTDYPTTADNPGITYTTLIVKPSHGVFNNGVATLRIVTSDPNLSDTISLYKIVDGATGTAACVVFLTNENITFAGNVNGKVAAVTKTCNVVAYSGTTPVTPTVGTISGGIQNEMEISAGQVVNNQIPLTITVAANSDLGGSGERSGVISVPITSPVTTTLQIQWSKVNTGATGAAGTNAIVFSLYAPNGNTFLNHEGSLVIQSQAYDGSTEITTGATYAWYKFENGGWGDPISGAAASSYSVQGSDVASSASFKCEMTYGGKTYSDVIDLIDKTDNFQLDVDSTAGDVFKNTVGTTHLIARLWQSGTEVDTQKSKVYATTAPSNPNDGDYYWSYSTSSPICTLMRWNATSREWEDVTSNRTYGQKYTYTWYRRDQNGDAMDSGSAFATGKVIYVDGDDVTNKTTFVCEVE